jgi:transposase-like protein
MKKTRFSEEQIIRIIKEQEAGIRTAEVCRKHGIAESTSKYTRVLTFLSSVKPSKVPSLC